MKQLRKYIVITVLLPFLGLINGCNDQLNLENIGEYDPSNIWNNVESAQYYVNNRMSAALGSGWPFDSDWSDESSGYIQPGAVTTDNGTQKYWPYGDIRRINIGLEEAEKGDMSETEKSRIMGQLYFLRAWTYFNMVFLHGGVPIIDHPQSRDEDLYVERNSTAECFDFIIADLDRAIASEINDRSQGDQYGMIDKAAAKAFKGRVLLYKASPLFNPDNPWGNQYWQDAYTANKTAYEDLQAMGFTLLDSYTDLFNDSKGQSFENNEYILPRIFKYPDATLGWKTRTLRPLSQSAGSTGANQPTWEIVKLFPMLDGKPIGESTKYNYSVDTYFQNRDPRFYANIYYNGCKAPFGGKEEMRLYTTDDLKDLGYPGQQDDALNGPDVPPHYSRTGFFPKKPVMEENTLSEIEQNDKDYPFIRFAEVILNYAEAANETGHQSEAIEMLRLIRERAGIEPGSDGNYGIDVSSRESLREVIQAERAIEFIHEGKRFDDLRRWRRYDELHNKPKHELYAEVKDDYWVDPTTELELVEGKDASNFQLLPEDFTYTVYEHESGGIMQQHLPEKYYFFPIQLSHMELNPSLEQTVGWDDGTFDPTL
jgi:hypothetical protein